jgi:osmotically inducible protein OsmC
LADAVPPELSPAERVLGATRQERMMAKRVSEAQWQGDLKDGSGSLRLGSGAFAGRYSYKSRFEDGTGTNPEELLAAAHAACFSMALSAALAQQGHAPTRIQTKATVDFGPVPGGFAMSHVALETEGQVPGIDAATVARFAEQAKAGCPVSKALAAVDISLVAALR